MAVQQRKGAVETFHSVGGTSWSGPGSCGAAGKVCVVLAHVFREGSAGSKLPVPSCHELLKLYVQWKVTGAGEEKWHSTMLRLAFCR